MLCISQSLMRYASLPPCRFLLCHLALHLFPCIENNEFCVFRCHFGYLPRSAWLCYMQFKDESLWQYLPGCSRNCSHFDSSVCSYVDLTPNVSPHLLRRLVLCLHSALQRYSCLWLNMPCVSDAWHEYHWIWIKLVCHLPEICAWRDELTPQHLWWVTWQWMYANWSGIPWFICIACCPSLTATLMLFSTSTYIIHLSHHTHIIYIVFLLLLKSQT